MNLKTSFNSFNFFIKSYFLWQSIPWKGQHISNACLPIVLCFNLELSEIIPYWNLLENLQCLGFNPVCERISVEHDKCKRWNIILCYRHIILIPWWHHQMETFSALLALCAGNSPVPGEFPAQRPVTWSFDVSFDLCLNKRLSKQWWGWWFETPLSPLWHRCNADKYNIK